MRADVSVDCLSNSAKLIAAGEGHLDVKSCPSSCLSANPSCPPPRDYCYCCLPEVPGGRQLSTLSLFVIVCKMQYLGFDCALIYNVGLAPVQFQGRKFSFTREKVLVSAIIISSHSKWRGQFSGCFLSFYSVTSSAQVILQAQVKSSGGLKPL